MNSSSRGETGGPPGGHTGSRTLFGLLAFVEASLLDALSTSPLFAIPSPDVVVNFFASAAQLLGLLTVVLGGAVFARRARPGSSGARRGGFAAVALRWAVGLLLVSLAANVLQYARRLDERNRRLQVNLTRSSKENGKVVRDTSLRTLSFSDQLQHPRGISTEELAAHLEKGASPWNLVDVREPEEVERGHLRGSWHIRYPDLRLAPRRLKAAGRKTVLLCYSGNRSSELCDEFAAIDIRCHFLVGGYEKWIAEERPLVLPPGGRPTELRSLPDFPGKDVLVDTPEVERLVAERGAIFVDVRYPHDYRMSSLPGAHNVPIRRMPSDALERALRALPRRPVIAPCYDRRGSFYALILGLRLHRLGYEFLGRYTLPHEYCVATTPRSHVESWKEARERGIFAYLTGPLGRLVGWLERGLGHLALAIAAAVLLLRLAILPLTLKAERDQLVLKSLARTIADIKLKAAGSRERYSRALLSLYRRHGIRPARNLAGTIVQLVLFIAFFAAVSSLAAGRTENAKGLWWIPTLSGPDPLDILPVCLGLLIWVHLKVNATRRGWTYEVLRLLAAGGLVAITLGLSAALNLYLVTNVGLMLLQNRLVARFLTRRERSRRPRAAAEGPFPGRGVIPLKLAHKAPGTGNKAARLARMKSAGLPVPDGFVLTDTLVSRSNGRLEITPAERRRVSALWRRLRAESVAVRSSGLNEDGSSQSYAGVFESLLNVRRENLDAALDAVYASLSSQRAAAYSGRRSERGGILIQEMVPAEYAGVLFTEHPAETGSMLVELVEGLGESLVGGTATPEGYRFGRYSGRLLDEREPPIDLSPLVKLGAKVERIFGKPQDIEWAYEGGRFLILQARDITTSAVGGEGRSSFEKERRRLLELSAGETSPREAIFVQNELSELLPRPTPLSLSFMESLWAHGGSTDLACKALGVPYNVDEEAGPFVTSVFGALYVNRREALRRLGKGPSMAASFRLARIAEDLEQDFREAFLPAFLKEMRLRRAIDVSQLKLPELVDLFEEWRRHFTEESYVQAEMINVAADFYVKTAERELRRRGLPPGRYLAHMPETIVHRAMSLLGEIRDGKRDPSCFLELFGHRAPRDYELAAPRYGEDSAIVREMLSRATTKVGTADRSPDLPEQRVLRLAIERARKFQVLKEEAKHHCLKEFALLRKVLLEIDRRLGLRGGLFFLTLEELPLVKERCYHRELRKTIAARQTQWKCFRTLVLPTRLSLDDLERLTPDTPSSSAPADGDLRGMLVAGDEITVGRARVINSPDEIDAFRDGEILVARFTDPTWTPLFPRAAGVVTEVGGRLSHAAIVAREYNITAVVGVEGALDSVRTGDLLKLHTDGRVERVRERRDSERLRVTIQVSLERQNACIEALLVNVSRYGALVATKETLEPGQRITLHAEEGEEGLQARVVREDRSGGYGLRFSRPCALYESTPS